MINPNAACIKQEFSWFTTLVQARFAEYFENQVAELKPSELRPPDIANDSSPYASLVMKYKMGVDERIILLLALAPSIQPQILDVFLMENPTLNRIFTEFGGWQGKFHRGFLPTCETAVFILGGDQLERRFEISRYFDASHFLVKDRIIDIDADIGSEPFFSRPLNVNAEFLESLDFGVAK